MGLLGTAAKAYVATRVIGSTHRRQKERWALQDGAASGHAAPGPAAAVPAAAQASAPGIPAPPGPAPSILDQLTQLGESRSAGVLTDAEFETQKQRILAGG